MEAERNRRRHITYMRHLNLIACFKPNQTNGISTVVTHVAYIVFAEFTMLNITVYFGETSRRINVVRWRVGSTKVNDSLLLYSLRILFMRIKIFT